MAATTPSCTPLINWIDGSSASASKIGASPVDGLKKINSTPAALSCCTKSAPPLPVISRIGPCGVAACADAANGARDWAKALVATVLMPSALKPDVSCRREMPRSRYCLIRSFIASSDAAFLRKRIHAALHDVYREQM